MLHISTRGDAKAASFLEAMLTGLAPDGGLFIPQYWPEISYDFLKDLIGKSYQEVAYQILNLLIDHEIPEDDLKKMINDAYFSFRHQAVCPLSQIDYNLFQLELYHGPTIAFKDVAMQLLSRLMDYSLKKAGRRATIVGATSGDTGSAAIEAFKGMEFCDVFILYPHNRISEVQRRQMTTVQDKNVHAIAVEGSFDDCQNILKGLFNDMDFRKKVNLSGVNSINWARVAAQTVYYFTSALSLGVPYRPVSFCVPTGNFGDILAGWVAKRMGLPIDKLVIASNENDILTRTYDTGCYEIRSVVATMSPSMDIQISSNFERLLFENYGRDARSLCSLMDSLQKTGTFTITSSALQKLQKDFLAVSVNETEVLQVISENFQKNEILIDPHTAIGLYAARQCLNRKPQIPVISLATAHASKFPDAVYKATGVKPELPQHLKNIMTAEERIVILPKDQKKIARFVIDHI